MLAGLRAAREQQAGICLDRDEVIALLDLLEDAAAAISVGHSAYDIGDVGDCPSCAWLAAFRVFKDGE